MSRLSDAKGGTSQQPKKTSEKEKFSFPHNSEYRADT